MSLFGTKLLGKNVLSSARLILLKWSEFVYRLCQGPVLSCFFSPYCRGKTTFDQAGIGSDVSTEVAKDDSMYDTYRKRMMLAYKFRPNPLVRV